MIKLIASDLDGTLLDHSKNVPADFPDVLHRLQERGILFAAATGRDRVSVGRHFGDCASSMLFLCDNGASLYRGDTLLDARPISREIIAKLWAFLQEAGLCQALLCGLHRRYTTCGEESFTCQLTRFYRKTCVIASPADVEQDPVLKFSVYYPGSDIDETLLAPLRRLLDGQANVFHSAEAWVDIVAAGVDKGTGLVRLCELNGCTAEDCLAFGDYYNDLPLLEAAGHAYVMPNAPAELKAQYPQADDDWMHAGVTKTIRRLLLTK